MGRLCSSRLPAALLAPWKGGAHTGEGFLAGLLTHCWSSPILKGLHAVENTHAGAVHEELNPWEGLTLKKFLENCLCWEEPDNGAGED